MKKASSVMRKLLHYCFRSNFGLTISLIIASMFLGFFSTMQVWILGKIVNLIEKNDVTNDFVFYIILFGVLLILQKISLSFVPYMRKRLLLNIKMSMKLELIDAIDSISPEIQELNDTQVKIARAFEFIDSRLDMSVISIIVYISSITSVVSITIFLCRYSLVFPIASAISSIAIVFIRLKQDKEMQSMYKQQYSDNQLAEYYTKALTVKESILELLLLNAKSLFLKRFETISRNNMKQRTRYFIKHVLKGNLLEVVLVVAGNLISICWAIHLLSIEPAFTIGALAIVINGIITAQDDIIGFAFNSKYIHQASLYGEDFWELTSSTVHDKSDAIIFEDVKNIELRNVSFKYPGRTEYSLHNINLKLNINETIGIVGENGSGKSTLSKIILGIYQPSKGEIIINGKKVDKKYHYKNVGAVFQDYNNYELTPRDNIGFGCVEKLEDDFAIKDAAIKADANNFIQKLNKQYDTTVGSLYNNSTHLSGGQWQRLAIARGFLQNSNIIAFDEPNSSIDAKMEEKLYMEYREVMKIKKRISYLISHRLGSTRLCDRIIVLDQGSIVEDGSFSELISKHGKYKEMYDAQAKWYSE